VKSVPSVARKGAMPSRKYGCGVPDEPTVGVDNGKSHGLPRKPAGHEGEAAKIDGDADREVDAAGGDHQRHRRRDNGERCTAISPASPSSAVFEKPSFRCLSADCCIARRGEDKPKGDLFGEGAVRRREDRDHLGMAQRSGRGPDSELKLLKRKMSGRG
jgi:hypothetical protein